MGYYKNLAIEQEEIAMGITGHNIQPKNGEIQYIKQNIATVTKGVIAHGCNYVGVMGAGVAKVLADKYPQCFIQYAKWLQTFPNRKDALGKCGIVAINKDLAIANCITQGLMGYDGQMATPEAIKSSLGIAFAATQNTNRAIYLPKIGAGLGGLDWEKDVEPIVSSLAALYDDVDTYVCIYP